MLRRHPRVWVSRRRLALLPDAANVFQVALILSVSTSAVRHWLKTGLKARREGRSWKIGRQDLESYLAASHRLGG